MRLVILSASVLLAFSLSLAAQVCPNPTPFGFDGLNGNGTPNPDNQAILNVFTLEDSSDPVNGDNTAHAGLLEPISVQFADARVPAGSPFTLSFSLGVVPSGISNPATIDGTVWLDIANPQNIYTLIDGLALGGGPPNPFGTTAGPDLANAFFLNTGNDANILNTCFTVQAIVLDPAAPAPFFLALSNPVALGIRPGIRSVTPSLAPTGTAVQISAGGAAAGGGDTVIFQPGLPTGTLPGGLANVPAGSVSGPVDIILGGVASVPSDDGISDWLAVIDQTLQPGPAILTLTPDPMIPLLNSSRATGFGTLPTAGGSHTWAVSLNAGDIIDIEVYNTDAALQTILPGFGSAVDPFATSGFDPSVTLQVAGNPDQLVFDTSIGPQNLHFDDDSGPKNNARLRWQARYTGTYNILVTDSNPAAFVSGEYILNLRVQSGVPAVVGFQNTSAARVNIAGQGTNAVVVAPGVQVGGNYSVILSPKAGAPFTETLIANTIIAAPGLLRFTVPTSSSLDIGLHQVRIRDNLTLYEGLNWDNSVFSPADGVLPDLLCIRGLNVQTATAATAIGGAAQIASLNAESVVFGPTTAGALGNGFVRAMVPSAPWSILYAEALAIDSTFPDLFDSTSQFLSATGGVGTGMYNPIMNVFYPNLLISGPYNDNDGIVPSPLFPNPMGIGRNAALIDFQAAPANPTGGNFLFLVRENIITGTQASHACLVNIVAK
ncbi:MAG: hypothetical protein R3F20_04975 [Planctomycetota bacterium]